MLQEKFLIDLSKELRKNNEIQDIIVFGSAARTNFKRYHDIDVLISFKNLPHNKKKPFCLRKLEKSLRFNSMPLVENNCSNYMPSLVKLNHALPSDESVKYHVFYCEKDDLRIQHKLIDNICKEGIFVP